MPLVVIESQIWVPRPPEVVRDFLRYDENAPRWRSKLLRSVLVTGTAGEVGARYDRIVPKDVLGPTDDSQTVTWELTELTDLLIAFYRAADEKGRQLAHLESSGAGTRLTLRDELAAPRLLNRRFPNRTLAGGLHNELRKLAAVLEHEDLFVARG